MSKSGGCVFFLSLILVLTSTAVPAGDPVSGEREEETVEGRRTGKIFDFYMEEGRLKGLIPACPEYEYPIRGGRISRDRIPFILDMVEGGRTISCFYAGKVTAETIESDVARLAGNGILRREKITVRRVKPPAP